MPNGGSSNCRSCKFNRVNQNESITPNHPETAMGAFCIIREIPISNPLWTYCANYYSDNDIPDGPIFSAGIHDENKIPWYETHKPKIVKYGLCHVCGIQFVKGINISISETEVRQFCCDQHYVKWWKIKNPKIRLIWDIEATSKDHVHADIKTIRKEIGRLKADLFDKYSTPEAYYARAEQKKDALVFSEILGVLQVAVFICEFYDTCYPIFTSSRFKKHGLEDVMTMVFNHYSYFGDVVTFCESIDTIHDPELRGYGDQMIKVLIKLLHAIDAVEAELLF